ncbi:MAG: hypothetical protein FJ087_21775, partial [Deltaproteobacteria bacterium]|nr:hypothetical protein [Deltaproteobacteria bacterium]
MTLRNRLWITVLATALATALAACSGDPGADGPAPAAPPGTPPGAVTSPVACTVPFDPDCTASLPYSVGFQDVTAMADVGWVVVDKGTPAASNWG